MMTQRILTADKVVTVKTTVREQDRVVEFEDILDSVKVEYDDYCDAPWENCDGYEHTVNSVLSYDYDMSGCRGYCYCKGRGEYIVIEVDDDDVHLWGNYDYYRSKGLSKQVAFEATARTKAACIDQLVKWYSDGWEYYYVVGEYGDYCASIGGVDSYGYAEELRYEIADEIADNMERDGFIVEGRYIPHEHNSREAKRDRLKRNLQIGCNY